MVREPVIHFLGALESWGSTVRHLFYLRSASFAWLPLNSRPCPQKLMEKDQPATQPLKQRSCLVSISQHAKGARRSLQGRGGGQNRASPRGPWRQGLSDGICGGRETALRLSGVPDRPHSSSHRLGLL